MNAVRPGWLTDAAQSGQHLWTVPPAASFIDALVDGLLVETGNDPFALTEITVVLPTRRSKLALREAFLRRSNNAPLMLPRILPLHDIDEEEALLSETGSGASSPLDIPPAIAPLARQILLARQIMRLPGPDGLYPNPEQAVLLAQELARLLDQVQTEQLTFDDLSSLVPDTLAAHWQITLSFLKIVADHWPCILAERGEIDPAEHRNRVFEAQADAWRSVPPGGFVVAAGSTGSVPATRNLLAVIADLPNGCVVLPGLDQSMDEESWEATEDSHPQFILKSLLMALNADRASVAQWPLSKFDDIQEHRQVLVSELMRPPMTSDRWQALDRLHPDSVKGIQRIEAPTPREEAVAIALMMRWVADDAGRTAALVTPDRELAKRVSADLERWELEVDDSAGWRLSATPAGVFLRLTAEMIYEECAPIPLLSALKHPLAGGGMDPPAFRDRVRDLELAALRGPCPPEGFTGLRDTLAERETQEPALQAWLNDVQSMAAPFVDLMSGGPVPLADLLTAHCTLAESLAASDDKEGPLRLWAGDAGEAVAMFIADLRQAAADFEPIAPEEYPGLLEALLSARAVWPSFRRHPRLSILGPLEARLLQPDVLILAGLNEGTWPADPQADPWMSRPMRQTFGLPQPERRIGQAAHDIAQGLCAPEVILTRSMKMGGAPTVPSRWWRRFDQVTEAANIPVHTETGRYAWLPWAAKLTRPDTITTWPAPAPKPPVSARPRRLSVTEVELWMRDPYEIYARHVLNLKALDPIDADASRADYGIIVHDILQAFIERYPESFPDNPLGAIRAIAEERFGQAGLSPAVIAFWAPRFEKIAGWFVEEDVARRQTLRRAHAEVNGSITLDGPAGTFELVAKADRIDEWSDGTLAIIDYKTGAVPTEKEVAAGYAPQLPLEAVIAVEGGFENIDAKAVSELAYWRLTGRGEGGEAYLAGENADVLRAEALEGVRQLITAFDDPNTPYEARPHPDLAPAYGHTQHLARVKEWATAEGETG